MENEISQLSQEKPACNTKKAGQGYQQVNWEVVLPAELYTASQLSQELKYYCKWFYFQKEQGLEKTEKNPDGYKHWQIALSLKQKHYKNFVINMLGQDASVRPIAKLHSCINYCQKSDTRIEGPYDHNSTFIETIKILNEWQEKLFKELQGPIHPRKIIWYYDKIGGKGKTAFCKFMYVHHKACILNNGKVSDIAFAVVGNPMIILFNITRSVEEYINYSAMESLKDGMIFSAKYESNMKVFNVPHVVVFANCRPDETKMSKDRWDIRTMSINDIDAY